MEMEAISGPGIVQATVCAVPLSTTIVTGSADGDSRSDTDHSLS
jgi:hypothetical protein